MGRIKKLKNNELVGGTDKTTIYPITSTKAIFEEVSENNFKSQKYLNNHITGDRIENDTITGDKLVNKTVTEEKVSDALMDKINSAAHGVTEEFETEVREALNKVVNTVSVNNGTPIQPVNKNINITVPENLAELNTDEDHRTVTDAEKSTWSGKQDALTFDNVPTVNSNNPVKSGGVYNAIQSIDVSGQISGKADKSEMSVVAGTGSNADKTTITLKSGTSATVLTQHQDVSEFLREGEVFGTGDDSTASFNPYSDTVWNKQQTLSEVQKQQIRDNIGVSIADNEDIQSVNGTLKFADRTYTATTSSVQGNMGYKILRKGSTFASQVTTTNTIYEIRYDYDLNGQTVTLPDGCVLKFNGGSLKNGEIVGNSTEIKAGKSKIFSIETVLSGSWSINNICPEWFGAVGEYDSQIDDAAYLQKCFDFINLITSDCIIVLDGSYNLGSTVTIRDHFSLHGSHYNTRDLGNTGVVKQKRSVITVNAEIGFVVEGIVSSGGTYSFCSFLIDGLYFVGKNKENTLFEITFSGAPARPCEIVHCEFNGFGKVLNLMPSADTPGTVISTFSIHGCNIYGNHNVIYQGINRQQRILGNTHIYDNVIEHNSGNVIDLGTVGSSLFFTNNLIEGNNSWVICIDNISTQPHIEVSRNSLEQTPQFVKVINPYKGLIKSGTITSGWGEVNLNNFGSVRIYDNYIGFSNNIDRFPNFPRVTSIHIEGLVIEDIDSRGMYYLDTSYFNNCVFSKNVQIEKLPTNCLGDINFFKKLPVLDSCNEGDIALSTPRNAATLTNYCCRKGIIGMNNLNIVDFEESVSLDGNYCCIIPMSTGTIQIQIQLTGVQAFYNNIYPLDDGFVVIKLIAKNDTRIRTVIRIYNQKYIYGLPFFKKLKSDDTMSVLSYTKNILHTLADVNDCDTVSAYSKLLDKRVYWNGNRWADNNGFTPAVTHGTTINRPTSTLKFEDAGFAYYDETIEKTITFSNRFEDANMEMSVGPGANNRISYCENNIIAGKTYGLHMDAHTWRTINVYYSKNSSEYIEESCVLLASSAASMNEYILEFEGLATSNEYPYIIVVKQDDDNENKVITTTIMEKVGIWKEEDGAIAGVARSGSFAEKPTSDNIYVGFKYFCTDKQTTEGATDGIEIIHKGNDVWVDALGRVVL